MASRAALYKLGRIGEAAAYDRGATRGRRVALLGSDVARAPMSEAGAEVDGVRRQSAVGEAVEGVGYSNDRCFETVDQNRGGARLERVVRRESPDSGAFAEPSDGLEP